MDNYFSSPELFKKLLKLSISAAGICRSNISKTIFPDLFSKKRKRGDDNNGEDDIKNLQT